MSTKVIYDADGVTLERLSGSTWVAIDVAAITLTAGYDVSERGVLLVTPDTCEFTVSRYVDEPIVAMPVGTLIRVRLIQPGLDELYRGLITDEVIDYSADAGVDWYGRPWRADHRVSTTGLAASRMAVTKSWKKLPSETVSARLGRWINVVDLGSATDALLPPETTSGSVTLMEIIRACSDYLGRPVRLVNNGSVTEVHVVTASTALPSGFHDSDALTMFTRATDQRTAGDRAVSFDPGDVTRAVSADLAPDDVRILHSGWRIPERLPAPFNDAGAVSGFSMSFTPNGCTGWVQFAYDTARRLRYRPPKKYVPGGSDTVKPPDATHAFLLAYTEITAATADPADGVITASFPCATWDDTPTTVTLTLPGDWHHTINAGYTGSEITCVTTTEFHDAGGHPDGKMTSLLARVIDADDVEYFSGSEIAGASNFTGHLVPDNFGIGPTGVQIVGINFWRTSDTSGHIKLDPAPAYVWHFAGGSTTLPTFTHHYGDTYAISTEHTLMLDDLRFTVDHMEIDYTLTGAITGSHFLTVYQCNGNAPDGTGTGIQTTGSFVELNAGAPLSGTIGFSNGGGLYNGDTDPANYYVATLLREHEHGSALSSFDTVGPDSTSEPDYVVPVVNLDSAPMDVVGSTLIPPAIAVYFDESVDVAGDYTLASPTAAALTSIQTTGSPSASAFLVVTGTGSTVARTIDVHSGDKVFVYVSTVGATEPEVTTSSTSLPLEREDGGSTETTTYVLYTGTADADGSYVVSANGEGDLSMSIAVIS